ncbi:Endonuclease/exonuclease/phosphatase [Xylaria sp. FL1777]|nr:Endonuclease/exonuclease/phosphatase [Xylaria sp. FL1777]
MNEEIRKIIEQIELARKPESSVPWKPDSPHPQPIYGFDSATQSWTATAKNQSQFDATPTKLALFSWNIDFMVPHARPRMEAGLVELQARISALPRSTAAVVFLQECVPADLEAIGATAWVQDGFLRTDVDATFWASRLYGTTTLVDRRLDVAEVFRTHYALTRMDRDALFVDVVVGPPSRDLQDGKESTRGGGVGLGGDGKRKDGKIIRFCNTHLESLAQEPSYRPPQVALAAKFMHDESIHGALLAGDLNAIQPFDRTLHSANGLRDAYLELGGQEDSEEGYTWGQQAPPQLRRMYGCSRMDKVFYCGGIHVEKFARFGADVEVTEGREREDIIRWGEFEKAWITDHLGVFAEVVVVD